MAVFNGTDASETIIGTADADTFYSSKGQDLVDGADGVDKLIVDYSTLGSGQFFNHNIYRNYDALYGMFRGTSPYMGTEFVRFEELEFHGSTSSDNFNVDLTDLPGYKVSLDAGGGAGVDMVTIKLPVSGAGVTGTLTGGVLDLGDVVLTGFEQIDITLGSANDNLTLGGGNDIVKAGFGDDIISVLGGNDVVEGGWGADQIDGGDGNDGLHATDGFSPDSRTDIDILNGGAGNDLISIGYGDSADGGSGTDRLLISLLPGPSGVTMNLAGLAGGGAMVVAGGTIQGFESYEVVYATNFADTITVGDFPMTAGSVSGGIFGFGGNDVITGGAAADNINGGTGDDEIHGGGGIDRLSGDEGADEVHGDAGNDTLWGADGDDEIHGGDGADTINGDNGADQMFGDAGNDSLDGGFGIDVMDGGSGNDSFVISENDTIVEAVGGGTDTLTIIPTQIFNQFTLAAGAEVEFLTLTNSFPNEFRLTGNEFAQTLTGNTQANTLDGGGGADVMAGMQGNDLYYVDNAGDIIDEIPGGGYDRVLASASYTLTAGEEIELFTTTDNLGTAAINLTGNALSQYIYGNAGANVIDSGGGGDVMIGFGGDDLYFTRHASDRAVESAGGGFDRVLAAASFTLEAGSEVEMFTTVDNLATTAINLTGNALSQYIYGNAGSNILDGGGGGDVLVGFEGDDFYIVRNAADRAVESASAGFDRVLAAANFTLEAGSHVEMFTTIDNIATTAINLTGNAFGQYLYGNAGANVLDGGGGGDVMVGFEGDDIYYTRNASDRALESAGGGFDRVLAGASFTLEAGSEVEFFTTLDNLATTAIDLTGNAIDQYLYGNAGANRLDGKGGADVLTGFGGADTFAFTTALGAGNIDRVTDYNVADDTIALDHAVFIGLGLGALPAGAFVTGTAAQDADDRIVYDPATGALFFDADGNGAGAAVQFATLTAGLSLTAGEFTVI